MEAEVGKLRMFRYQVVKRLGAVTAATKKNSTDIEELRANLHEFMLVRKWVLTMPQNDKEDAHDTDTVPDVSTTKHK